MVPGLVSRRYRKGSLGLAQQTCKNNCRLGSRLHPNGCSLPDRKVRSPQGKEGRQGIIYIHKAKEIGTIAFHITANDIASSGAELVGILLTIIMPPNSEEGELKQIMDDVSQLTAEYHVEILGGHTEVSAVVNQTLVSVTGIGRIAKDKLVTTKGLKPGQDLVVTKWVGLEGTSIIATEFEKELKKRKHRKDEGT